MKDRCITGHIIGSITWYGEWKNAIKIYHNPQKNCYIGVKTGDYMDFLWVNP